MFEQNKKEKGCNIIIIIIDEFHYSKEKKG